MTSGQEKEADAVGAGEGDLGATTVLLEHQNPSQPERSSLDIYLPAGLYFVCECHIIPAS